jgi:hypothetical protein
MEWISRNIFDKAIDLIKNNYDELTISSDWLKIDSILINHKNKTYWFTDKLDANHIIKFK